MRFPVTTALAFALVGPALAKPGVSPAAVSKDADPGSSFKVDKVVTTPEIPPKPDVVLLVDVTGSMGSAIDNIKKNLDTVIDTLINGQPDAQIAVASFGDLKDPNGFTVNQGLTASKDDLHKAVNKLKAELGGDIPEDWINALYKVATGAINFRSGSSRIIVLVGDAPSKDPSGGHTLPDTITVLKFPPGIRVIAVNVGDLDHDKQATTVTAATGGVIIGSDAKEVTKAIISGLKNLDVTVKPEVISCNAGLTVQFNPTQATVSSGKDATFQETVKVAGGATQGATLHCLVRFLLNGTPGGDAFIQSITVKVNQITCFNCIPHPGKNLCHPTTSCTPTPYGTMCLTRPGYKADGAADGDTRVHWRMVWPVPGHEHRVAVKPGTKSDTECDKNNVGPDVCKEVKISDCKNVVHVVEGARPDTDQKVIGEEEL